MVHVKTAGNVYALSSGKQLQWAELPQWLRKSIEEHEMVSESTCGEIRAKLEKCIIDEGFWEEDCVGLLSEYDKCQTSNAQSWENVRT